MDINQFKRRLYRFSKPLRKQYKHCNTCNIKNRTVIYIHKYNKILCNKCVKTYVGDNMKLCKKCNLAKSLANFYLSKVTTDGYRGSCKTCYLKDTSLWQKFNPDKCKAKVQRYRSKLKVSKLV